MSSNFKRSGRPRLPSWPHWGSIQRSFRPLVGERGIAAPTQKSHPRRNDPHYFFDKRNTARGTYSPKLTRWSYSPVHSMVDRSVVVVQSNTLMPLGVIVSPTSRWCLDFVDLCDGRPEDVRCSDGSAGGLENPSTVHGQVALLSRCFMSVTS